MPETCAWCGALRGPGPKCPACGAVYAKAEALRAGAAAPRPPAAAAGDELAAPLSAAEPLAPPLPGAPAAARFDGVLDALRLEWLLRLGAVPAALAIAALVHRSPLGHLLQRTFLSMMVHEAGHAVTSWLCGFAAFPGPWVTYTAGSRGLPVVLLVAAAGVSLVVAGRRAGRASWTWAGAVLLSLQLAGTLLASARTAQALIVFGGDGGALVLGALLMASFFSGRDTQVYRGQLRWGFLVIGASSFVDAFATWWAALADSDAIPLGEIEGVGLSDPSKLMQVHGWGIHAMVHRYVGLGFACLAGLAVTWAVATAAARRAWREAGGGR
ncbi:hypothetical protein [Anaeromyxobacter paludicola]|uniref:Peptidase M50B-like protein n=1 Tax=Anaeromyxobacter paludicola TaxID=2918171 RepID=A0ABN6N113_9BACT|nr:hypothetical protein [Anaeromyxobacter paludicola]BDG06905.1 hypothetical protein AMPC_00180 [Anaeromyxobacter paludicola]